MCVYVPSVKRMSLCRASVWAILGVTRARSRLVMNRCRVLWKSAYTSTDGSVDLAVNRADYIVCT
jgi:hypothetical protein